MWECTIESLKELEKGTGSGCILAHCMVGIFVQFFYIENLHSFSTYRISIVFIIYNNNPNTSLFLKNIFMNTKMRFTSIYFRMLVILFTNAIWEPF